MGKLTIAERMAAAQEKGGKHLWYFIFAECALDLFARNETISADDVAKRLTEKLLEYGDDNPMLMAATETARVELYLALKGSRPVT